MATIKQRKAFKAIIENHRSVSGAMRDVGYAATTATVPRNLVKSKGWLELCDEMGLTDELLTTALVDDIKAKPQNRTSELQLGFKVRGKLDEPEVSKTLILVVSGESAQRFNVQPNGSPIDYRA